MDYDICNAHLPHVMDLDREVIRILMPTCYVVVNHPLPVKINHLEKMSSGQMDASMKTGA